MSATPEPSEIQTPEISLPIPYARWARLLYGLYVLVIPGVAFWATDLFKPEWQNGELDSYIILLLSPIASLLFFPLLLYSVICYLLLLIDFERFSMQFIVRFGIYTGVLLSLQFSIVSGIYFFNTIPSFLLLVLLWVSPILAVRIYAWAVARWDVRKVNIFLIVLILIAYIAILVMSSGTDLMNSMILSPLLILLMGLTIAAPFWSFLMSVKVAVWLFRHHESKITVRGGLGIAAWLGIYITAWRYGILKMYELYAALPPEPPPDCYIATAAAQGHLQFVASRVILRIDGTLLTVNRQLQTLKFAELAMMAVLPRVHKVLRRIYDVIGQFLARKIQNPFLADFAYLMLKPFETLAAFILRLVVPEFDELTGKLYIK